MRPLLLPAEGATGVDPLPVDAATTIRRALVGRHITDVVLVLADGAIELEDRDQRASLLRRAGCYEVARAIRRAAVPPGHVLVFVDSERGTNLTTTPLAELLALAELPNASTPRPIVGRGAHPIIAAAVSATKD